MNLVKSKSWSWVFIGGLLISIILSAVIFVLMILAKITTHSYYLITLLPPLLWVIIAILLNRQYGSTEQKELQKLSGYSLSGLIAFFSAFILGIISLKEQSRLILTLTIIIFYIFWFLSWYLLKKYSIKNKIKISWRTLWIMTGTLLGLIILGQIISFFTLNIISYIILFGGIALVYYSWGKKFFQELKQRQIAFHLLLFLAFNLLSFILWTAIFLFLIYGLFIK